MWTTTPRRRLCETSQRPWCAPRKTGMEAMWVPWARPWRHRWQGQRCKGRGAQRTHEANAVSALSPGGSAYAAGAAFLGAGAAGPPSASFAWSWPQARQPRDHAVVMAVQHFSVVTGDTDSEDADGDAYDLGSSRQARQVLRATQEGRSNVDLVVLDTACARSVAGKEWLVQHAT